MNASVKDVMTTQVVWVEHDTPFAAIAASLRQFRVNAFPVLDDGGHVIGVVSESDLLAKLALDGGEGRMPGMITGLLHQHEMEKARGVTAEDLMTSPAATVSPDDTVENAARLMYVRRVKRLPVIDADGRLAGIVSRADVLAVYGRADVEIGEEIRNDIATCESTADAERFDVSVTDGVVTLTGLRGPSRKATTSFAAPATSRAWWPSATASPTRPRARTPSTSSPGSQPTDPPVAPRRLRQVLARRGGPCQPGTQAVETAALGERMESDHTDHYGAGAAGAAAGAIDGLKDTAKDAARAA